MSLIEVTDAKSPASVPESEAARIRGLLRQHKFSETQLAAEALLARVPDHRDVLLFAAIALRYQGRSAAALSTLATLEQHYPRFSRLYEERGRCFIEMKQAPEAIEAFLKAVSLNHALTGSWRMLDGLYRMGGQLQDAATAASQVATLEKLPAEVVTATGFFEDGDLDAAEPLVRGYLLKHGNHIEAMRLLARIGIARSVFDDAELLLAAVLKLAPEYRSARREYAETLIELNRYPEAQRELELLLKEDLENRSYYQGLHATVLVGLGQHEQAIAGYRALLNGSPADADFHLSIAHALKTLGRQGEAIESYRRAADCRPNFGDAYWSLANLKTYRFTTDELARLAGAQADPAIGLIDRFHVAFALGKALEDQGDFAESFRYYTLGNALKRSESRYRPEIIEHNTRQQIEVCSSQFFSSRTGWGVENPDPIFIVGLPRSGSTLIEQILASHSQVEGTQELGNIQQIVAQLRGRDPDLNNPRYPGILAQLSAEVCRELGEQYITSTRIYRTGKLFFIDKMPNNFRHLGLIRLMLPNARIIDARREPMACCFSNFKQLFAKGQEFTYSVADIARYYRTYLELMRHWNQVLPGWILRAQYEDLVEDLT